MIVIIGINTVLLPVLVCRQLLSRLSSADTLSSAHFYHYRGLLDTAVILSKWKSQKKLHLWNLSLKITGRYWGFKETPAFFYPVLFNIQKITERICGSYVTPGCVSLTASLGYEKRSPLSLLILSWNRSQEAENATQMSKWQQNTRLLSSSAGHLWRICAFLGWLLCDRWPTRTLCVNRSTSVGLSRSQLTLQWNRVTSVTSVEAAQNVRQRCCY